MSQESIWFVIIFNNDLDKVVKQMLVRQADDAYLGRLVNTVEDRNSKQYLQIGKKVG